MNIPSVDEYIEKNFISKEKIRKEIEILRQHKNDNPKLDFTHNDLMDSAIAALEELLNEEQYKGGKF